MLEPICFNATVFDYEGNPHTLTVSSEAEKYRAEIRNSSDLALRLGWPVDCIATAPEMAQTLRGKHDK